LQNYVDLRAPNWNVFGPARKIAGQERLQDLIFDNPSITLTGDKKLKLQVF
jgi:hypothetical protein